MNQFLDNSNIIKKINKKITIENNQTPIVKKAWFAAGFFLLLIFSTFQEWSPIAGNWPLMAFSFFFLIVAVVVAIMFRSRKEKLKKLITGENIIAQWTLTSEQQNQYVNTLFKNEIGKNQVILFSISFIAIIVFGVFILFIEEGKLFMLFVLIGLIAFLALFAFGMPYYYRYKNSRGDGQILIGSKYAYVNGYFHNWDFPFSGIKKVKIIKEPFYGLSLVYYYTDRTFQHSEELNIPADEIVDLREIIEKLKKANSKRVRKEL